MSSNSPTPAQLARIYSDCCLACDNGKPCSVKARPGTAYCVRHANQDRLGLTREAAFYVQLELSRVYKMEAEMKKLVDYGSLSSLRKVLMALPGVISMLRAFEARGDYLSDADVAKLSQLQEFWDLYSSMMSKIAAVESLSGLAAKNPFDDESANDTDDSTSSSSTASPDRYDTLSWTPARFGEPALTPSSRLAVRVPTSDVSVPSTPSTPYRAAHAAAIEMPPRAKIAKRSASEPVASNPAKRRCERLDLEDQTRLAVEGGADEILSDEERSEDSMSTSSDREMIVDDSSSEDSDYDAELAAELAAEEAASNGFVPSSFQSLASQAAEKAKSLFARRK